MGLQVADLVGTPANGGEADANQQGIRFEENCTSKYTVRDV